MVALWQPLVLLALLLALLLPPLEVCCPHRSVSFKSAVFGLSIGRPNLSEAG